METPTSTPHCEPDTKTEEKLELDEINNALSSLGMLSEAFLELTDEERNLVNSHSLGAKAAKNKKLQESKEKNGIKQTLLERKAELDKKMIIIPKQPFITATGQKASISIYILKILFLILLLLFRLENAKKSRDYYQRKP